MGRDLRSNSSKSTDSDAKRTRRLEAYRRAFSKLGAEIGLSGTAVWRGLRFRLGCPHDAFRKSVALMCLIHTCQNTPQWNPLKETLTKQGRLPNAFSTADGAERFTREFLARMDPVLVRKRMAECLAMLVRLTAEVYLGRSRAAVWFRSQNPCLRGKTPDESFASLAGVLTVADALQFRLKRRTDRVRRGLTMPASFRRLRLRDLPESERTAFETWLADQPRPVLYDKTGTLLETKEQDGYFLFDYARWKAGI